MAMALDLDLYMGEDVPVRYDLVFKMKDGNPVFVLSARHSLISGIPVDAPIIRLYQKDFKGIGEFSNSNESLGFGGIFIQSEPLLPIDGFSTWEADIPTEVITDTKSNWVKANQLSCSLSIILRQMEFADQAIRNTMGLQQLAIHLLLCRPDMDGFALAATLSPDAREYICSYFVECQEEALKSMIAVFRRMWASYFSKDEDFRLRSFRVWDNSQRGTSLVLDVPGDATGIYVDGSELNERPGWNLHSHNVDSPIQQLSLLAGLCSMLRLVRGAQLKE